MTMHRFQRALLAGLSLLAAASFVGAQTARTITFQNECSSDVWIQPTSGAAGSCSGGCPGGSTCAANGNCYFNNPTPSSGNYRVVKGGSNTIVYPFYSGENTAWNGNFAFCQSGTTCQQTASVCDAQGCGTTGPYALAEFNLAQTGTDFYDVSIISGVAVPISITPEAVDSTNTQPTNPYGCGNPGSPSPDTTGLGAATWSLSPPSNLYQWVTPTSLSSLQTCTSSSNCPSGQTCGVIFQSGEFQQVCGYLSGYWSEGAICGFNVDTSYFPCSSSVVNGPYTTTISGFQGCAGTSGSCYSSGADQYCCGCANWNTILGANEVPSSTGQCVNTNPTWTSDILPTIEFLKQMSVMHPSQYLHPGIDWIILRVSQLLHVPIRRLELYVYVQQNVEWIQHSELHNHALSQWRVLRRYGRQLDSPPAYNYNDSDLTRPNQRYLQWSVVQCLFFRVRQWTHLPNGRVLLRRHVL